MATEKTPPHKRIERAEKSAVEWKMKAIERREEAEQLKRQLDHANERLETHNKELNELKTGYINTQKQLQDLTNKLESANQTINEKQLEIHEIKKKASHKMEKNRINTISR